MAPRSWFPCLPGACCVVSDSGQPARARRVKADRASAASKACVRHGCCLSGPTASEDRQRACPTFLLSAQLVSRYSDAVAALHAKSRAGR